MSKSIDDVIKQLRSAGLQVDAVEVDTSDIVRVPVEGDKGSKKSGWYRVYTHASKAGNIYYVGRFGNWKNDAIPENGQNLKFDNEGLSAEDRRAIKVQQDKARKQAASEKRRKQTEAAKRAKDIWRGLPEPMPDEPTGNPYLVKKQVGAFGIRYAKNSALVVPLRAISGDLIGLQFINADGSKRFLTGTAKQGAFHAIGDLENGEGIAVLAEGYATAASVHMATGLPAIVAFDAGNLISAAEVLRDNYPSLKLIIAADDDVKGRECADKAAKQVGAAVVVPKFRDGPERGTDFNDLHCLEGIATVRTQFEPSMKGELPAPVLQGDKPAGKAPGDKPSSPFVNTDKGLYYHDQESDRRYWICSRLDILGRTRDESSKGWGVLLRFQNHEGALVTTIIYDRQFATENGQRVIESLLDLGLNLDVTRNNKTRLLRYLQRPGTDRFVRLVNKLGWNKGCYLQPNHQIGNPDEPLFYYSDRLPLCTSAVSGTLDEWQQRIAQYCVGNPVLSFCVATAFVGPLLQLIDSETFGIHLYGDSSLGKSSGLSVAASVCGGGDYLKRWNSTSNALEPMAAEHSDGLLVLDEISQALPHEIGSAVYMLGNGQGKARATDTGTGTRKRLSWRLVFLSSGEHTLAQHMDSAGRKAMAGMEVRLLNIPATRFQHGAFETTHEFQGGDKFSNYIETESRRVYGAPLRTFIEKLSDLSTAKRNDLAGYLQRTSAGFQSVHLSGEASGQAYRAASKFALVAAAGEIAIRWGVLPWQKGEVLRAADELFKLWLAERGGEGSKEDNDLLEHLASELLGKAESHFTRWDSEDEGNAKIDTHQIRSQDRWGFRRTVVEGHGDSCTSEEMLYIYPAKFRKALCKDFDYKKACELLLACDALKVTGGRGFTYHTALPGGGSKRQGVYLVKLSALINYERRAAAVDEAA